MRAFSSDEQPNISERKRLDWLRLIRTDNIGPITFYELIERFGGASEALQALPDLSQRGGRKKPLTAPPEGIIMREYERIKKLGGDILTVADEDYPLALSATDDAPPIISVLGNAKILNQSCIAIVGARNASLNGKKMAYNLSKDLGTRKQIIISGLARGIDTAAHQGAIDSGTIAVVAGGIDVVYPPENQNLYDRIKDIGCIVAESPLGQKPFAASFPRRNRIVSGISKAVIVVEATQRSGSLITARLASEQGRDIFAVPGSPMDPRASGPNHLIREGATLIRSAEDIMEILMDFSGNTMREPLFQTANFTPPHCQKTADQNDYSPEKAQREIMSQLSFTPISVDELIRACDFNISAIQMSVLELELAGRIKRLPGNKISLLQEE